MQKQEITKSTLKSRDRKIEEELLDFLKKVSFNQDYFENNSFIFPVGI